ncbi:hypothetical protein GUITHDRAFT_99374 [Guillardia theta CCMP2712]|uniref:RWP-RK domain-containing protein n=1 Tax=Guillardia theta (strain CCMP2712) TaxID=905079 RepID=L1K2A9_GUITC|nr:hypothetical protein GUITHDRAFT_99374 [Guillardia theta CCMP2712]EKX54717.1 hypothetical protein GUITHDRAFT_99374 [Guillardia theta CCMP2712]|eukprot:XP_005841697.1 hypothetical protein GUITHDRAFT_99374 [Guillardia theta CCMP2712]
MLYEQDLVSPEWTWDLSSDSADDCSPSWILQSLDDSSSTSFQDSFFCLPLSHPSLQPIEELEDHCNTHMAPLDVYPSIQQHDVHVNGLLSDTHGKFSSSESICSRQRAEQHAHKSAPVLPSSHRNAPRYKQPVLGIVRVQSRQSFFQSDKPVEITLERLAEHFHESLEVAAAKIGIGKSTMKLVCRQLGVQKWPYKHNGGRKGKIIKAVCSQHVVDLEGQGKGSEVV